MLPSSSHGSRLVAFAQDVTTVPLVLVRHSAYWGLADCSRLQPPALPSQVDSKAQAFGAPCGKLAPLPSPATGLPFSGVRLSGLTGFSPKSRDCRADRSLAPWPQRSPSPKSREDTPSQLLPRMVSLPEFPPPSVQIFCSFCVSGQVGGGGGGLDSRPAYARMSWVVYFSLRSLVALGPGHVLEVTGLMWPRWLEEGLCKL